MGTPTSSFMGMACREAALEETAERIDDVVSRGASAAEDIMGSITESVTSGLTEGRAETYSSIANNLHRQFIELIDNASHLAINQVLPPQEVAQLVLFEGTRIQFVADQTYRTISRCSTGVFSDTTPQNSANVEGVKRLMHGINNIWKCSSTLVSETSHFLVHLGQDVPSISDAKSFHRELIEGVHRLREEVTNLLPGPSSSNSFGFSGLGGKF